MKGKEDSLPFLYGMKEKRFSKMTLYENVICEKITIIPLVFV